MPNILDALREADVTDLRQSSGLQVFGLRWRAEDGHDYATLDEALKAQSLEVTEVSSQGSVPTLKLINKSDRRIFLMAGEELVGGKQNRVLNASMMVSARGEIPVPVTCVERGRWGYKSSRFASGTTSSHSHLRLMISKQVSGSYRAVGAPRSDQGEVWREVDRKMEKMGSRSSSDALQDMYKDYAARLETVLRDLPAPTGSNGAAFAIHGKIVGADLFDKAETLGKLWPKLIKSFAVDALEAPEGNPAPVDAAQIREWLQSASSAEQHWFDSPGLGKDVRIEGKGLVGATLVVDERPVHLELFREEEPVPNGPR